MKKSGRPSKYKPEYGDILIQHMKKGYSFESFGAIVRVNRDTLYEWASKHEEFSDAKKLGQTDSLYFWEQQGIDGLYNITTRDADGGSNTVSLNTSAWIFSMKNRHNWTDKREITADVKTTDSSSDEIKELAEWLKNLKRME